MPGKEERILRELKRLQKRRVTKRNRSQAHKRLQESDFEAAAEDDEVPQREQVKDLHIGKQQRSEGEGSRP